MKTVQNGRNIHLQMLFSYAVYLHLSVCIFTNIKEKSGIFPYRNIKKILTTYETGS